MEKQNADLPAFRAGLLKKIKKPCCQIEI